MILKNVKKVLSGIMAATFLVAYTAPMGMCVSAVSSPNLPAQKPVLRTAAQPASLKLEGDLSITKGNPKISLSLRDSDVQQVLRMFADKAGLNIIFHDSVTGKVTMDLVNVPLNDAFKMVLQVTNLTYYVDRNTMVVTSAEAASKLNLAKQELMTIPVKYVDASILASFLNKNIFSINKPGLSNAEIAITNPSSNEILIFGTKNDYLMAKKVVAQFDKKPLEETFVVNHTTPREMAELICNLLFKQTSSSSGSSSSSSSGSSGGSGSTSSVTLGGGVTQCQISNAVDTGTLASLNTTSLAVTYFAQRGAISIIGGSAQQMALVRDFIAKNDKKQPQAYLEVSIIELNESGSKQFNNTWNVRSGFFSGYFNGGSTTNDPNFPFLLSGDDFSVYDTAKNKYAELYKIGRYSGPATVAYTINYIVENSKGRVLANPKIIITNGETSTIDLSSDYVKTVTSEVLSGTGALAGAVQRTYDIGDDEGIEVSISPFISPDGYVTLNIKPEYSTIKDQITTPNQNDPTISDIQATLLQRRNLDLKNVRIKDGETLVIGGMIRETETKSVAKVPFLGDLPGIGMLFRNTTSRKEKQELVIMITPKIIKDSDEVVNKPSVTL